MRSALTTVVLVLVATFASAQFKINPGERSDRNAEYRQTAANYCRLDFDGARITSDGWNRIQPLTTTRDNPEFKRFMVVNRYQILPDMRRDHGRSIFDVQYDVVGEYDLSGGYFPSPATVTVQVEVSDSNGEIRIAQTSDARPFVGRTRFQQWLQAKLATETDPASKGVLQSSIERFQNQTKKPQSGQ
ncbi:hypothetical protein Acid345_3325 [Candidatus Koribacter versatilis Ellin345]|uniref:DUF4136 domain-containing protein n=1 Tax=Koribacter versatilis (strain Ellin345) TaxID=204669 RepID=Q1ILC4_KORVE|nr:hypothetical protein [Candidatus Koribacter versatilis]ABF42326.1 hypothetical protein Acid345_3325 [Candidatus Koribacter versatilis Ellin345]